MNVTRFPRRMLKTMLAVAALSAALVLGAAGQTRTAKADSPLPFQLPSCTVACTVELSFDTIRLKSIDDGWSTPGGATDQDAEVYGYMFGQTSGGAFGARKLGPAGGTGPCGSDGVSWTSTNGNCLRTVVNSTYQFAQTEMCATATFFSCSGSWAKNNNRIKLTVKPGENIRAYFIMQDYDETFANDTVCDLSLWVGPFTSAQLMTLNQTFTMTQGDNGHAGCDVQFTVKRVS